jgi:2,3-bisphosphoglycerate-independent phosphoglycerate mutase
MEIQRGDIAARGNFCTLDQEGRITDRRAGRIPSDQALPLVSQLSQVQIPEVSVEVQHVREYRFAVQMRGENLSPEIEDTDPQETGVPPNTAVPRDESAERAAALFNEWIRTASARIQDHPKANGFTLRGFSTDPRLPAFPDVYSLRAACIAVYPMYRGVSKLVGMDVIAFDGERPEDEFQTAGGVWEDYDFFFIHIKKTDSRGEDGDFDGKLRVIESVDAALPSLLASQPDVLIVTGDHSTPSRLRTHSWHPVPTLLWAPATVRQDGTRSFHEQACLSGGLGTFNAKDLMPLALAHAGRLGKYGA